ncbi:hypothetical protein IP90_02549 [Luteimonas cucumeris]|uniref:Uncharacterized protein n=1 Tax=Luteimonas cucumeris TaxID=985012 RepID=A0A562KZX9_9GAMM|nr:hypothetical protein [Luteimonas cucumeris]TWI00927.1 hypothetical protein IP90_02549 [Luteimonas cucumeris]
MRTDEVYIKTDAGRDEIDTRARRLSPALRSMLLVVDGRRDVGQLRELATGLHAPHDALAQLAGLGLIVPQSHALSSAAAPPALSDMAGRYRLLSGLMSEAVRQHLGLRGYFMQLKIERCADTDELSALLPELRAAIARAKGVPSASQWEQGIRAALA